MMAGEFYCRHRYPDGFVLESAFVIPDGVTGIHGPSGSGKTTILMLMAGLLKPQPGRIVLGDTLLVDTAHDVWLPPHRRAVGVVFQNSLLFPHRSVRANLTFGQKRKPSRKILFPDVVKVLELEDLLDRRPATLSGGQARRVAIGRALLRGPELLILDEPWVGLEHALRDRIVSLIQRCLNEWDIPTLIVSHELPFLRSMTKQLIQIDHGVAKPGTTTAEH